MPFKNPEDKRTYEQSEARRTYRREHMRRLRSKTAKRLTEYMCVRCGRDMFLHYWDERERVCIRCVPLTVIS
jgi:hypothetical protein